jgi:hypothetical protein
MNQKPDFVATHAKPLSTYRDRMDHLDSIQKTGGKA